MPNIDTGFRLYPRGFLGKAMGPRLAAKPKPYDVRLRTAPTVTIVQPQLNTADASPVVETIYAQYIKRPIETNTFDFREKILLAALDAFGHPNFLSWYEAQLQSPSVGDTHLRFLDDTLRFISTGRRNMSLETWASFLQMSEGGVRPAVVAPYAASYFEARLGRSNDRSPVSLIETIIAWTSQPGGFEDLLGTLHLLFGQA
ncbi:hypothetical protein [Paraburkholderia sp. BCC1886]|uniref:hypothetical protein n=1 Tax=Paraburkholderia sp. BCC1886 TaxID=2562670 RepID=UPI00118352D3|nr:hypothetical protein [Paraburkholderia sp. BCC1886]